MARSPRSTARHSASTPTTKRATTCGFDYAEGEFTPETEAQAAWADFAEEMGTHVVAACPERDSNPHALSDSGF